MLFNFENKNNSSNKLFKQTEISTLTIFENVSLRVALRCMCSVLQYQTYCTHYILQYQTEKRNVCALLAQLDRAQDF